MHTLSGLDSIVIKPVFTYSLAAHGQPVHYLDKLLACTLHTQPTAEYLHVAAHVFHSRANKHISLIYNIIFLFNIDHATH